MSVVTTVVLLTSIMESEEDEQGNAIYRGVEDLNARMLRDWFKPVHDHAGGNKAPQAYAFMAAINHLDLDTLKQVMRSVQWVEPDHVTLMVNLEEDLGFHVEPWR